jgi:hypothetical protein
VLPYFLAKFFVAMISGPLLTACCPPHGERHSSMLWVVIGVITLVGPVAIVALRNVINPREAAAKAAG